jgi:predicted PurR-regulated permease PerM
MKENNPNANNGLAANPVIHYAIQLLALALLMVWCFRIVEPFITPLVWGSVLAIALYPFK